MLNPTLYNALVRIFGKVIVTNQDQQAVIELVPGAKYTATWRPKDQCSRGEQYGVQCPYCKDPRRHLFVSYLSYARPMLGDNILSVGHLYAQCFRRNCLKKQENRDDLERRIGIALAMPDSTCIQASQIECLTEEADAPPQFNVSDVVSLEGIRTWVDEFIPCTESMPPVIAEYLDERRITQADLEHFAIGWGAIKSPRTGFYINGGTPWVIFPIFLNNKLVGVQARCLPRYLSKDGIKYWFHPGCRKRTVVYNIDEARKFGVGVLSEGVFDVCSIGKPGIATFGHTPSPAQQSLLITLGQGLIWCPDTNKSKDVDAIQIARDQVGLWNSAGAFNLGAHVVILSAKDPGEMNRQDVWTEILKQVPAAMQDYVFEYVLPKL